MSDSRANIIRRRRSKASRIEATAERSPETAASAARWHTLATLEVARLWRLPAALMTSVGPIIQPTRQPVMAHALATPVTTRVRTGSAGATTTIDWWVTPLETAD